MIVQCGQVVLRWIIKNNILKLWSGLNWLRMESTTVLNLSVHNSKKFLVQLNNYWLWHIKPLFSLLFCGGFETWSRNWCLNTRVLMKTFAPKWSEASGELRKLHSESMWFKLLYKYCKDNPKGFWWCYIALEIIMFMDFVHCLVFLKKAMDDGQSP